MAGKRRAQSSVIQALKNHFQSNPCGIPGKENVRLWVSRNRSPQERNKLRALLSLKDLGKQHIPEADIDLDWGGKLFKGEQVLWQAASKTPTQEALMMQDRKGDDTGYWLDPRAVARILQVDEDVVRRHYRTTE